MTDIHNLDIPLEAPLTGEKCPKRETYPCKVDEWVYAMESVHPRMFGVCEFCRTFYIVVLPRRRGDPVYGDEDWILRHWQNTLGTEGALIHASEAVLKGSGTAQRLWYLLAEHPLSITQRILWTIRSEASDEVRNQQRRVDELTHQLWRRMEGLEEQRRAMSKRGARGAALKALAAARAIPVQTKAAKEELAGLRAEIKALRDQIRIEREAARREPLPLPTDYAPPTLAARSVLCDSLTPCCVIYGLVDPADPELIRYVGKTVDYAGRYRGHMTQGADAVTDWADSVRLEGRSPVMVLLERCDDSVVSDRERHWIHYYRDRYQADLNRSIPRKALP